MRIQELITPHQNIPLKQMSLHVASRTLGMKLEPALIHKDATDFIIQKIN